MLVVVLKGLHRGKIGFATVYGAVTLVVFFSGGFEVYACESDLLIICPSTAVE
jgi:hypothetical protein